MLEWLQRWRRGDANVWIHQTLTMRAGESRWLALEPGAVVHVRSGLVLVRLPLSWLSGCLASHAQMLNSGDAMEVHARGLGFLEARTDGEILVCMQTAGRSSLNFYT